MDENTIWYTRCPVPTASGIAVQRGLFDQAFAGSGWQVRNIRERGEGADGLNTHFSHSLDNSFREGGGSPPIWARANGADTSLLGVSFVEETLALFVRTDDDIQSVTDLAGRRLALPVWPDLIMNFFRFAAQKAFVSALQLHGMQEQDAHFVDVVETGNHFELLNPGFAAGKPRQIKSYYHCQMQALLDGEVDAFFAKGGEINAMLGESGGRVRMLYNLMDAEPMWAKVNNATPRILTVSNSLVRNHPEQVVRYARTLLQAAQWAATDRPGAVAAVAPETGVSEAAINTFYTPDFHCKLRPSLSPRMLDTVVVMKDFLLSHGYIDRDIDLDDWQAADLLRQAYDAEGIPWDEDRIPLMSVA